MIAVCEYFGGSEDLRRAQRLEELLREAGKEIPEDFIKECFEIASRELRCDYLGELYGLVANTIADDVENEINALFIDGVDTEYYPNYISSSAQTTVYFAEDIDDIIDDNVSDYEEILSALQRIKERYGQILDEFFIELTFDYKGKEYSLDEMIDYFGKLIERETT